MIDTPGDNLLAILIEFNTVGSSARVNTFLGNILFQECVLILCQQCDIIHYDILQSWYLTLVEVFSKNISAMTFQYCVILQWNFVISKKVFSSEKILSAFQNEWHVISWSCGVTASDIDNTLNVEFAITGGEVHSDTAIFYKYHRRSNIQHQENKWNGTK